MSTSCLYVRHQFCFLSSRCCALAASASSSPAASTVAVIALLSLPLPTTLNDPLSSTNTRTACEGYMPNCSLLPFHTEPQPQCSPLTFFSHTRDLTQASLPPPFPPSGLAWTYNKHHGVQRTPHGEDLVPGEGFEDQSLGFWLCSPCLVWGLVVLLL